MTGQPIADPFIFVNLNRSGPPSAFYVSGVDLAGITTQLEISTDQYGQLELVAKFHPASYSISVDGCVVLNSAGH